MSVGGNCGVINVWMCVVLGNCFLKLWKVLSMLWILFGESVLVLV